MWNRSYIRKPEVRVCCCATNESVVHHDWLYATDNGKTECYNDIIPKKLYCIINVDQSYHDWYLIHWIRSVSVLNLISVHTGLVHPFLTLVNLLLTENIVGFIVLYCKHLLSPCVFCSGAAPITHWRTQIHHTCISLNWFFIATADIHWSMEGFSQQILLLLITPTTHTHTHKHSLTSCYNQIWWLVNGSAPLPATFIYFCGFLWTS